MTAVLRLMALALVCALTSCIDGREEIWLAEDGSGRADVTYSFPAAAARFRGGAAGVRKMVEAAIAQNPALTDSHCEVTTIDDRIVLHLVTAFTSVHEIADQSATGKLPSAVTALSGVMALDVSGRDVEFSRTIDAAKALPGAKFLPDSTLAGRKLVYIVHLPIPPETTNATETRDGGTTLVWDIPLQEAVAKPLVLQFRGTVPLPSWVAASSGALAVAAATAAAWLALRKWRIRQRPG